MFGRLGGYRAARTLRISFAVGFTIALVTGCSNKLAGMGDDELQDKSYACRQAIDQSPGFAISCDNYKRECERRREAGRFLC